MNDMSRPLPLAAHLRGLSQELAAEPLPGDLPQRMHRAVQSRQPKTWRRFAAWSMAGLALTATAAVLVLVNVPTAPSGAGELAAGFVPVAGSERWREAAQRGTAWLVPTELPQSKLAALGLPYDPARAGERVRAQLLIHSSGDVLAVRVIH